METKEQKIKRERGEYTRARKKKFDYLKHTGQMGKYYLQKKIKIMPKIKSVVEGLKWWQRIYIVLVLGAKRLWRKLFQSKI